ncbi:hypothetical protein BCR41DRAFT_334829 [Lobosporangium transversale]|uniref:MYND-type domain-containing protein n=1 Tax=Lobosporangium transversale TaxID=64571 RepID=A0A1Y2GS70_9FUNG|nr:hypothetical protein BCR41DRAFT_334829 [Lobosporangium transversale]ORZ20981.1 hypothetical protein BCR41DRAFT_334829 [Lobosporangium transversale]|eukprot:XP_021882890.1 hypothetical protein BCR41DRAFT_334829 [Lobosporangium transversale]
MVLIEEIFEKACEETNLLNPDGPTSTPLGKQGSLKPFMNLSREQCQILLALYHVVDPSIEAKVPILFPEMARKFIEDRKERNSNLSKLKRGPEVFTQEVLNLQEIQKAVSAAYIANDMDLGKAQKYLNMKPRETPMDQLTVQEVLTQGLLLAGFRDNGVNGGEAPKSPLAAPNFREAKAYYDYAFDKFNFSLAAVQLGSFYFHEHKECQGRHCLEGEDPEQISFDYYLKAAEVGNPMAMHKVGWYYDQKGQWHKAIEWYNKTADDGYPDSAHNLGMIYQEGNANVTPKLEVDLDKAIEYYTRGLQYGYGPSGTQLGRLFFQLATDREFRQKLPSSSQYHSSEPQEYFQTAISYFNQANHLLEVESLQFLGMIYGSKDFGLYNIDSAQNLFELAFMASNGSQRSFELLCKKVDSEGLKTCAAKDCENKETKKDQFQRCGGCKKKYYCSRLCQIEDWKARHKKQCKK